MFSLVAFGGAGPMTAVDVAHHLKIPEVVVPIYPGITSAFGLLTTDLKYEFVKTELLLSTDNPGSRLRQDDRALVHAAREQLLRDGLPEGRISFLRSVDLRYLGQGYELRIAVREDDFDGNDCGRIWNEFHARHRNEYGHSFPQNPIEVVNLRVTGIGLMPRLPDRFATQRAKTLQGACLKTGETYFRVNGTLQKMRTELFDRMLIPAGAAIPGPAVFFQKDTTTVLPPAWTARADEWGNLVITRNT
jgi:N-methylhydantoinase A